MIITESIIKYYVSQALSALHTQLKNPKYGFSAKESDLTSSLDYHLNYVNNWSKEVQFKEMMQAKSIGDIYIDLEIQLTPKKLKLDNKSYPKDPIIEIVNKSFNHCVILGDPGAGKTTTIKKLCRTLLYDELNVFPNYSLPILIQLRDLKDKETLYSRIKSILGIEIFYKGENEIDIKSEELNSYTEKIVNSFLDNLNAIILIDGLDEVSPYKFNIYIDELRSMFLNVSESKIVLTCRSASFNVLLENSTVYEICALSKEQIIDFITKWFIEETKITEFLQQLNKTKFKDTAFSPLTLAHLCALYEKTNQLPEKPKTLYRKLITLLIEDWNEQRGILKESKYSNFGSERQFEFLSQLAFELTKDIESKVYSTEDLTNVYRKISYKYDLPKSDALKVAQEIESHNGLIVNSGYEKYEFAHKSLQEYLAAEYIVKMPQIPTKLVYDTNISNELAIAISLSSEPNQYFYNLVFNSFSGVELKTTFITEFLRRMITEKPDFQASPLLAIALIYPYHLIYTHTLAVGSKSISGELFENHYEQIIQYAIEISTIKKSILLLATSNNVNIQNIEKNSNQKYLIINDEFDQELSLLDEVGYVPISSIMEIIVPIYFSGLFE